MRTIGTPTQAALQGRVLIKRELLFITGKSFADGTPGSFGFWTGRDTVTIGVIDPDSDSAVNREYVGVQTALKVADIPATSNASGDATTFDCSLSQTDDYVAEAVRGYDLKGGSAQIHRLFLDPDSREQVEPAICRFVGYVDKQSIVIPSEGGEGTVALTLASHTRDLGRNNPDVCSDESQQLRHAGDGFFKYSGVVPNWTIFWGETRAKTAAAVNAANPAPYNPRNYH